MLDRIFLSPSLSPTFNLALEEYLFKSSPYNIFLLYRNTTSVVVGKHQNAFSEVDISFVEKYNIPVLRRISGGGTVFHDEGNFNYSVIQSVPAGVDKVNFAKHLQFILDFLQTKKLDVYFGKRNEILCHEKKISGTACHVFKNRTLHHGSFLFKTDLTLLHQVIGKHKNLFSSKAVPSVSSPVINVSELLPFENIESLLRDLCCFVNLKTLQLTADEYALIKQLEVDKYQSWEWNWGYSPKFIFQVSDKKFVTIEKGLTAKGEHFRPNAHKES